MKLLSTDDSKTLVILLESRDEAKAMVSITEAALTGKALNKRSNAYKMAKTIDDDLPAF